MRSVAAAVLVVVVCVPGVVWGQEGTKSAQEQENWEAQQRELFSKDARQRFYEEAKLEVSGGMWRSAVLPGWGNIWADQVFKGVALLGGFGIGAVVLGAGIWRDDVPFVIGGGALGLVCYGTSLVTTYLDVSAYNTQLMRRYKLAASQGGAGVGWSWAF